MQPWTSDSVVLGWGMGIGIFRSAQDDANNQKPLSWWKECALLFGIINIRFKTGCPRQKEPVRAHSWWAGSPEYQTGPNLGPAASAQGQELVTSPKPRGQPVGGPGPEAEEELDQRSEGKPVHSRSGRVAWEFRQRGPESSSCAFEGLGSHIPHLASEVLKLLLCVADHSGPPAPKLVCMRIGKGHVPESFLLGALLCVPVSPRHFSGQPTLLTVTNTALVLVKIKRSPLHENAVIVSSMIPTAWS